MSNIVWELQRSTSKEYFDGDTSGPIRMRGTCPASPDRGILNMIALRYASQRASPFLYVIQLSQFANKEAKGIIIVIVGIA